LPQHIYKFFKNIIIPGFKGLAGYLLGDVAFFVVDVACLQAFKSETGIKKRNEHGGFELGTFTMDYNLAAGVKL